MSVLAFKNWNEMYLKPKDGMKEKPYRVSKMFIHGQIILISYFIIDHSKVLEKNSVATTASGHHVSIFLQDHIGPVI